MRRAQTSIEFLLLLGFMTVVLLSFLTAVNARTRDANRQTTGGYEASDTAYSVGLGREFGPDGLGPYIGRGAMSLGGNIKYLHSKIGPYAASAVATSPPRIERAMPCFTAFSTSGCTMRQGTASVRNCSGTSTCTCRRSSKRSRSMSR